MIVRSRSLCPKGYTFLDVNLNGGALLGGTRGKSTMYLCYKAKSMTGKSESKTAKAARWPEGLEQLGEDREAKLREKRERGSRMRRKRRAGRKSFRAAVLEDYPPREKKAMGVSEDADLLSTIKAMCFPGGSGPGPISFRETEKRGMDGGEDGGEDDDKDGGGDSDVTTRAVGFVVTRQDGSEV